MRRKDESPMEEAEKKVVERTSGRHSRRHHARGVKRVRRRKVARSS